MLADARGDLPEGIHLQFHVGDKPHLPFGNGINGKFRQNAKYGHIRVLLDGLAQNVLMPPSGSAVQNHAPDVHIRIKGLKAPDNGSHCPGHLGAIGNDNNGAMQSLGQFRRRIRALYILTIVKAAVAFDQRQILSQSPAPEDIAQNLRRKKKRIQICCATAAGKTQPFGINVIWTLFKNLDRKALFDKGDQVSNE